MTPEDEFSVRTIFQDLRFVAGGADPGQRETSARTANRVDAPGL